MTHKLASSVSFAEKQLDFDVIPTRILDDFDRMVRKRISLVEENDKKSYTEKKCSNAHYKAIIFHTKA
jgi:hypothetical protein